MHKVMNETTSRMRGLISRRMFSQAGIAALSAKLLPRITFGFATADAAAPSSAHGLPTLDELGTGWLDCGLLAQMPSQHNFQEMAACALDLVGINFLPGGQLYGDESGLRWPVYHSLPLCGMTIDGRSYDSARCRWFCTLFGYLPKFGGTPELLNADTPRGFTGELRHVCCGAQRYTIQSRETGLMLEIET